MSVVGDTGPIQPATDYSCFPVRSDIHARTLETAGGDPTRTIGKSVQVTFELKIV